MAQGINFQNYPSANRKLLRIGAVAIFVILALVAIAIYLQPRFRVLGTNPDISNMSSVTPFLKVTFSQPLSPNGLSVSANPNIIESTSVNDKTLTIALKSPTDTNTTYTITINSVNDTLGDSIRGKSYSFTPKSADPSNIPADQQQALLQRDSNKPYTLGFITFSGDDKLMKYGLTAAELDRAKDGFFKYFTSSNQKIRTVTIDPGSIQSPPYDPNNPTSVFILFFNVTFDNKIQRKARLDYTNLTSAQLRLYDPTNNNQLFDSGMLTSASN